jgi:putative CocE/NonD family hydrolase
MRDGVRLFVNLFKQEAGGSYPVIMSVTPYGKDKLPDRLTAFFMRLSGVKFGKLNCSRLTGFEAPDPVYWVEQGYAVLQADVRGMHKSEGQAGVLRQQDAEDYYDLIEWAASQSWCTGRVGIMGVSYLAMSQWHVAGNETTCPRKHRCAGAGLRQLVRPWIAYPRFDRRIRANIFHAKVVVYPWAEEVGDIL